MFQFGEAARLYAENEPVVREMHKALTDDLTRFFTAISEKVRDQLLPTATTSVCDGSSWYWWLGTDEWREDLLSVHCAWNEARILAERRVQLRLGTKTSTTISWLLEPNHAPPPPWTRPRKSTAWRVLEADVVWSDGQDPVESVAAAIASALHALTSEIREPASLR